MKSPPHPGRQIKSELEFLNVPVTKAAEALGVTRQQLNNVIGGRSGITPEMALRLELGIGGTAESWMELQRAYDLAQVRERAAAIAEHVRRLAPL
ncbi:MAG: HigA family addiction module antitoxin [Zavarzinia sp.]|nr:HigA family addiction module antitoxin [Zavarzinia sp.]